MSLSRAFDLAQWVNEPANVGDGVVVSSIGPPFTGQFAPLVTGGKPGVTVGANVPAATGPGQILQSDASNNWTAAASSSSLPVPNAQGQTLVAGVGPGYAWTLQIPAAPPAGSNTAPIMDGVAAPGSGATFARADHVHPSDTSRYAATNPAGYQTAGQVTAAINASAYTLPTASVSTLGGVKVDGSTITIAGGVISSVSAGGGSSITAGSTTTTGFAAGNLLVSDGSTVRPANGSVYPATGAYATAIQKGNATYPMYESAYIPNGGIYRSLVWNATGGLVAPGVSFVLEPGAYNSGVNLGYKGFIGWNTGSWGFGSFPDIALIADGDVGPGIISARTYSYGGGGGGPSALRAYNVYTDFNNGEWAALDWRTVPNTLVIGAQANGSGAIRNVNIVGAVVTINGNPIDALDCGTF
jgi:hypothetical protein